MRTRRINRGVGLELGLFSKDDWFSTKLLERFQGGLLGFRWAHSWQPSNCRERIPEVVLRKSTFSTLTTPEGTESLSTPWEAGLL